MLIYHRQNKTTFSSIRSLSIATFLSLFFSFEIAEAGTTQGWDYTGALTATSDWNLGTNWGGIDIAPENPGDDAFFGGVGSSTPTISQNTTIDGLVVGGKTYTFTNPGYLFTLEGADSSYNSYNIDGPLQIFKIANGGTDVFGGNGAVSLSDTTINVTTPVDVVKFANYGSSGSATINLYGTLIYEAGSTGGYTNVLSNGGTIDISGASQAIQFSALSDNSGGSEHLILGANSISLGSPGIYTNYDGIISGTGSVQITGGNIGLSGANTYTGSTTINSDATLTGGTGSFGSTSEIYDSGTLQLSNTGSGNLSTPISGIGTIDIMNSLTLSGMSSFFGTTVINNGATLTVSTAYDNLGGSLVFSAAGGTVQAAGPFILPAITLNGPGTLGVGSGNLMEFQGISGTGTLIKSGNGNLNLYTTNNYSGGTDIVQGTVGIMANNALSTGPITVGSGTTLYLDGYNQITSALDGTGAIVAFAGGTLVSNSGNFSGTITGDSSFSKSGSGTMVLDGASTFAGTSVSSGTLEIGDINNSGATLTSPVTVTSGGTLMGHGTIIGAVANGGIVQPGGTIGTLTVNGNYTQSSGGTLAIELNPTTSSRLAVNGNAALSGGLLLLPDAGTYTPGTQYIILTAGGGVTGTFTSISENGNIPFGLTYLPNAVDLTVGASGVTFHVANLTPNEANATNAIESILSSPSGNSLAFTQGLVALATSPANSATRTQLAGFLGEARADLASVALTNLTSFHNFLVDRIDHRQGLTDGIEVNNGLPGTFDVAMNDSDLPLFGPGGAVDIERPQAWVRGYGVLGTLDSGGGFNEAQYRTGGIVGGLDAVVADGTLLGAAIAYEHTDLNLSGDSDENNIDTYRIDVYGSQKLETVPLVIDGALGYAFNDYHNNDFLPLAGSDGFSQTSHHTGNELTADAGVSDRFIVKQDAVSGVLSIVPRVGIEYDNIQQNPYATTGAPDPTVNFLTNGSTLNALRSSIGAKADLKLTTDDGTTVTPELRASYLHDFMDTNVTLTEAFAGAPTAGFRVSGVHPGREAALVGTGLTAGLSRNISATIGYDAAIRARELDHTVQAGLKYSW